MSPNRRIIAIAGGGIGGLATALCLAKAGFRVQVFERSDVPAQTGTGIQLSPNAYKVLRDLGLERSLARVGFAPDKIEIFNGRNGQRLTSFDLGEAINQRHGAPYLVLHRCDLAEILEAACAAVEDIKIYRSHAVIDLAAHPNGVTVLCDNKGTMSGHLASAVVGADGIGSKLRPLVQEAHPPRFTGHVAWRAIIVREAAPSNLSRASTGLWLGHKAHIVHYPIRGGTMLNVIAITPWSQNEPPHPGWLDHRESEGWADVFSTWHNSITPLLNQTDQWGGWPIFSVPSVAALANGPLCLLGDAGHAMVPYGAQGGACAIEDAAVLTKCCAASPNDRVSAFQHYEKTRKSRANRVLALSQNNRRIYHLGFPMSAARDTVMKATPQGAMQKRMDWLYGWEA